MIIAELLDLLSPDYRAMLDDLSKFSHPGKSLRKHIGEVKDLASRIFSTLYPEHTGVKSFLQFLCESHDIGKLNKDWNVVTEKRRVKGHSREGCALLSIIFSNRKAGEILKDRYSLPDKYVELLIYFIYTHHSKLQTISRLLNSSQEIRLREFSTRYHRKYFLQLWDHIGKGGLEELPILVDAFGIFKLADIASAAGYSFREILEQFKYQSGYERIKGRLEERSKLKRGYFDRSKFEFQKTIANSAKHVFLTAPTGWGKTAVALLKIIHEKPAKVFYVLPTITAVREFMNDLCGIFGNKYVGEYFYFADVEVLAKKEREETKLMDFYKYFIRKVNVVTIDQLLLTMLNVGKYFLRRFNLKNSLLIVDEYHLLTQQMVGALKAFIDTYGQFYNFSTLLMSASPMRTYKEELCGSLKLLTHTIHEYKLKKEYGKLNRHKVQVLENQEIFGFAGNEPVIEEALANKKKILIILNTVDGAIKFYKQLKERFKKSNIQLLHRRYAYSDRREKEELIGEADVLVATQVAEVSLDVSFDTLITELAPLPSLIQRLGRVNRYAIYGHDYNVYVCCGMSREGTYRKAELRRTKKTLKEIEDKLNKKGEKYWIEALEIYEESMQDDLLRQINETYRDVKRLYEEACHLYSLTMEEQEVIQELRGTNDYLAIPDIYVNEVQNFLMKKAFRKLKKYFIPVPFYIKERIYDEKLGLYIVGQGPRYRYDKKLGLYNTECD